MFGPAPGGAAMMDMEMEAAQLAIETQMYITWRPPDSIQECTRVGPRAKCFCGHLFGNHSDRFPGKCGNCVCKRF